MDNLNDDSGFITIEMIEERDKRIAELEAENEALMSNNKIKSDVIDTKEVDVNRLYADNSRLRAALLKTGAWKTAPCIVCGYNGPGYYQPDTHSCAKEVVQLEAALKGDEDAN